MKTFHKDLLYYGDMKPANILLTRSKRIKIGDFGSSIVLSKKLDEYYLKGLTPGMGIKEIEQSIGGLSID